MSGCTNCWGEISAGINERTAWDQARRRFPRAWSGPRRQDTLSTQQASRRRSFLSCNGLHLLHNLRPRGGIGGL